MVMKSISFVFLLLLSLLFMGRQVLADDVPSMDPALSQEIYKQMESAGVPSGLAMKDPRVVVARFVNVFLGLLSIIFLGYTVYAGYLWMTAGGEEEKTTQAKAHLRNGIIGLAIILSALGITLLVTTYLIRATSYQYYQPPLPYEVIK